MYCRHCKREISQHDNFCTYCGTYQQEPNVITKAFGLVLRIFAFVFVLVFLYGILIDTKYGLGIINVTFFHGYGDTIFLILFAFGAILGLWMAFVLMLVTFCQTPRNTPALTYGVVVGALTMVILRILLLVFFLEDSSWFQDFMNRLSFTSEQLNSDQLNSILIVLICVVGVYFLLLLTRQAPKIKTLFRDSSGKLSELFAMPKYLVLKLFNKRYSSDVYRTFEEYYSASNDTINDHIIAEDSDTSNDSGTDNSKRSLKTNRSFLVYIVFSIITFGIFDWFYMYSLAVDVDIMCKDDEEKIANPFTFFVLNIITCGIYSFYQKYNLNNRLVYYAPRYGLDLDEKVTKILLLCSVALTVFGFMLEWNSLTLVSEGYFVGLTIRYIASFMAMFILIKNTNTLADVYNRSDSD